MHLTRLSASDTLLAYSVSTSPLPLQASLAGVPPSLGSVTVVVGNNSDGTLWCDRIVLGITVGDPGKPDSIDLTEVDGGFTVEAAGGDWTLSYAGSGRFVAAPATPGAGEITTQGLSFTIGNIQVSPRVGTTGLTITEHSSTDGTTYGDRQATVLVPKFPNGFSAGDLAASAPSVDYGGTVRLTWAGTAATYTLRWDRESADVTRTRAWTSPPLVHDTTFILYVQAQQDGETVTESFSVTVVVSNPSLVAHDLTVQNLATLQGGARVTGGATLDTATITGDATVKGTVRLNAAELGRRFTASNPDLAMTVGRDITVEIAGSWSIMTLANYADVVSEHCMGLYLIGPDNATMLYSTGPIQSESGSSVLTHLPTQAGPRVMASPLSPAAEVHLSGRGRLRGGAGRVDFDGPTADLIAHEAGYRVLLTAAGPCNGLYAGERDGSGFSVGECAGGTSDAEFDWLVIAPVRESLESGRPAVLPMALARRPG